MLFPTIQFGLFFPLVFVASWLLRPHPQRWKVFMLAASYIFYAAADKRFCLLLAASTLFNQLVTVLIDKSQEPAARRLWLWVAVAGNLGALGFFKYYGFFVQSFDNLLSGVGVKVPLLQIVLPAAISFFTFQALSYVIDTYRGKIHPAPLLDFAVYLSFFPHLLAGPIVRASEFLPQLKDRPDPRRLDTPRAFRLIMGGLFKKVVISSFVASAIADKVFAVPNDKTSWEILIGIYAYAVQIYADFSGYTDIAIGLALLLGVRFPPNFDAPYTSKSLQEFWRRWHMTLSRWLRDYLYIPLGGNRGSEAKIYRNLMLTMLLGGLWHGASWTFVVWGGIHGVGLAAERFLGSRRERAGLPAPPLTRGRAFLQWFVTFHIVCLAWVFFRADGFGTAWTLLSRLPFHWLSFGPLVNPLLVVVIALSLAAQFVPEDWMQRVQAEFSRRSPLVQGAALGVGFLVLDAFGPVGVPQFIYFRF